MPKAERSLRIVITSEARLLNILRCAVRFCAREAGVPESDKDCLIMAIDEAASNIIRHVYKDQPSGRLGLEILAFPDRMEFTLEDSGPKVSTESWQPRTLDDVRPGGLGTHIIKCFMDEISYDKDFQEGNRLRLVKHFTPAGSASHEGSGQERK